MRDEDLERVFAADAEIVPSSGFVASVMEAVRLEAATPPQIPFPWTRAVPLFVAAGLTLVSLFVVLVQLLRTGASSSAAAAWMPELIRAFQRASAAGAGWVIVASLLALVSVRFAMRMAGAKT